jgi:hypothetical protein
VATRSSSALSLRSAATCAMSPVSCNSTLPFASLGSSSCLAKELLPNQDNQAQIQYQRKYVQACTTQKSVSQDWMAGSHAPSSG